MEDALQTIKSVPTFWVKIYIAGPVEVYNQVCREHCLDKGDCVTITETNYIYTGGEEKGVIVEWINYGRFPRTEQQILATATQLGQRLMIAGCQTSYSIVSPRASTYCSRRKEIFGEEKNVENTSDGVFGD